MPPLSTRTHHFYISIAKHVFLHEEYGLVFVQDPIRLSETSQFNLAPLILYGLSVPGTDIRWSTFSTLEKPRSITEVLIEAWNNAEGLCGHPDTMIISKNLADACPTLRSTMALINIDVQAADKNSKSHAASLRTAQRHAIYQFSGFNVTSADAAKLIGNLQASINDHNVSVSHTPYGKAKERFLQWMEFPRRKPIAPDLPECPWDRGRWLSSWDINLPPNQARHLAEYVQSKQIWLRTGDADRFLPSNEDDYEESIYDNSPQLVKALLTCWPNTSGEIASLVGITVRQLQWFCAEKSELEEDKQAELLNLLGIEFDDYRSEFSIQGPCVLIAKNRNGLKEIYSSISNGGDASPFEIVPDEGFADPSWRYFVINTHGKTASVVMAARGSEIADQMPDILFNFAGIYRYPVSSYRAVVGTCARACSTPERHVDIMQSLWDIDTGSR